MKSKMKILSLIMAVAMVSSMFVACKSSDDKTPAADSSSVAVSDTASKEEDKAAPSTSKDPVKLKWYHMGDAPKKDAEKVIAALNEQSMKDIQTEIDFQWATGDDQKLKTLMSTGGEFDIAFTSAWYANYVLAAQGGQLADLTEKVKTVTPKLYEYIPEIVWEGSKVNGKIYAIPSYKDTAASFYWTANKEYVIDEAKAEAEFDQVGERLSTATPLLEKVKAYADSGHPYANGAPAALNFNWNGLSSYNVGWDTMGLDGLRLGVKIIDTSAKVMPQWEDKTMLEDFNVLKSWHDNGLTPKDALTTEKYAEFHIVSVVQAWDGAEAVLTNGKPYTYKMKKRHGPVYTTSYIQGAMNGISPNSPNIDRALQYLEYVNTDKVYRNMIAYGIEGVNWELTDEGNAKALNSDWMPAVYSQGSFFELYPLAPAPADMYVNLKASNDSATPSPLVGFVPDIAPIQNEVAACNTVTQKYFRSLQTGDVKDVEATCAKAMKELRATGYDKIITELQKQVDAFLAAK